jgi:hypothetical protein
MKCWSRTIQLQLVTQQIEDWTLQSYKGKTTHCELVWCDVPFTFTETFKMGDSSQKLNLYSMTSCLIEGLYHLLLDKMVRAPWTRRLQPRNSQDLKIRWDLTIVSEILQQPEVSNHISFMQYPDLYAQHSVARYCYIKEAFFSVCAWRWNQMMPRMPHFQGPQHTKPNEARLQGNMVASEIPCFYLQIDLF